MLLHFLQWHTQTLLHQAQQELFEFGNELTNKVAVGHTAYLDVMTDVTKAILHSHYDIFEVVMLW